MEMQLLSVVRALHLLAAALWLGAGALLALYVMPAIRQTGAAGGAVMAEAVRRGLVPFMAIIAGSTVLTGLLMYGLWVNPSGGLGLHSRGGIVLALGALAGIVATILGGAVLGRGTKQLAVLASGPASAASEIETAALHQRMTTASKVTLMLLVIALLLMVFSHFV